jgi:hypothetical protein
VGSKGCVCRRVTSVLNLQFFIEQVNSTNSNSSLSVCVSFHNINLWLKPRKYLSVHGIQILVSIFYFFQNGKICPRSSPCYLFVHGYQIFLAIIICANVLFKVITQGYPFNTSAEKCLLFFKSLGWVVWRGVWSLCHKTFEYSQDNSHLKYLRMRSGKLRVFSTPRLGKVSDSDIWVGSYLSENQKFMTVGPGSWPHLNQRIHLMIKCYWYLM